MARVGLRKLHGCDSGQHRRFRARRHRKTMLAVTCFSLLTQVNLRCAAAVALTRITSTPTIFDPPRTLDVQCHHAPRMVDHPVFANK